MSPYALQMPFNLTTEGVFVGDDAFPLRKNIMKPYSMKRPLTVKERKFNYRLHWATNFGDQLLMS